MADPHPLRAVLAGVTPQCCPNRLNFHCHTLCSDGSLEPQQLAAQAVHLGLEHLAVTDHHSVAAHAVVAAELDRRRALGAVVPTLWTGVEISCLLSGCLVHVLALGFDLHAPALQPYLGQRAAVGAELQADAVRRAIHAAGGLVLLAHPARYRLPYGPLLRAAADLGFDGAEAWYDYGQQAQWSPTPLVCEAIATRLAEYGLLQSCGTDTHGLELCGR